MIYHYLSLHDACPFSLRFIMKEPHLVASCSAAHLWSMMSEGSTMAHQAIARASSILVAYFSPCSGILEGHQLNYLQQSNIQPLLLPPSRCTSPSAVHPPHFGPTSAASDVGAFGGLEVDAMLVSACFRWFSVSRCPEIWCICVVSCCVLSQAMNLIMWSAELL